MIETKSAKWRPGFRSNVKPDVVLAEVEAMREETGIVKPGDVVARARPKRSPLHRAFEWSDTKAAGSYRTWQARKLLANLVVVTIVGEGEIIEAPVYVSVFSEEHDGERGYARVTQVLNDEDLRLQALSDTLKALNGLRRRYNHLKELAEILDGFEVEVREALAS